MTIQPALAPALLDDVTALNRRFIAVLVEAGSAEQADIEPALHRRLCARLESGTPGWPDCPFLLYRVVGPDERDGIALDQFSPAVASLVTLTLGFLWQLARDNAPAARAVSGADDDWCSALSALDIARLSMLAGRVTLRPRLIDVPGFWHDLARRRGISALQRASLGAAGMQLIMAHRRRARAAAELLPLLVRTAALGGDGATDREGIRDTLAGCMHSKSGT